MTGPTPPIGVVPERTRFAHRLLQRVVAVGPEEARVVMWCWLYIFAVLSSYYIMRPMRDQMGVAGGVNNLQWLFTGTLAGMLLLNLPFAWLVKKLPRRRFIPLTYRFFAASILAFGAALHFATPEQAVWIGRFFFIWTSVFNLFVVSIFWAMVVDIFSSEQGKRLFGRHPRRVAGPGAAAGGAHRRDAAGRGGRAGALGTGPGTGRGHPARSRGV